MAFWSAAVAMATPPELAFEMHIPQLALPDRDGHWRPCGVQACMRV